MNIIDINHKNSLNIATKNLQDNCVVAFPTDTVYGIGCRLNTKAIKKLYKIKNRPLSQPTAILLTKNQLNLSLRASAKQSVERILPKDIKKSFFEGKTTVIFPTSFFNIDIPKIIIANNSIGIRLPNHPWIIDLINKTGQIVASSANKKGERTPTKFEDLSAEILEEADLVIKTNKKLSGKPSAIYDVKLGKYLR